MVLELKVEFQMRRINKNSSTGMLQSMHRSSRYTAAQNIAQTVFLNVSVSQTFFSQKKYFRKLDFQKLLNEKCHKQDMHLKNAKWYHTFMMKFY